MDDDTTPATDPLTAEITEPDPPEQPSSQMPPREYPGPTSTPPEPSPLARAASGRVMRTFTLQFRELPKGRAKNRAAVERRDIALAVDEAVRAANLDLLAVCELVLHWMAMRALHGEYRGPSLATLGPQLQAAMEAYRPGKPDGGQTEKTEDTER